MLLLEAIFSVAFASDKDAASDIAPNCKGKASAPDNNGVALVHFEHEISQIFTKPRTTPLRSPVHIEVWEPRCQTAARSAKSFLSFDGTEH